MAYNYSATIKETTQTSFENQQDLTTGTDALSLTWARSYTYGTGANKAQIQWHDERSLATTTNETLDLQALAGGMFGTANFSKVKEIRIRLVTTTAGYRIEISPGGTNPWLGIFGSATDKVTIYADGVFAVASAVDGFAVSSTSKTLKINNPSGGSVTYDIVVIGEGSIS